MAKDPQTPMEDVKREFSEEELKVLAAQLRKPEGEIGAQVGERMNAGNARMNLHTLAVVCPEPGDKILEIGMGTGHFVKNILHMDESIRYTGCDYSPLMVEAAVEKNRRFVEAGRAEFVLGDAGDLPFASGSFTKIFTVNTLYFWEQPEAVLEEFKRVLRGDGSLILSLRPKHNLESFPVTKYGFRSYSLEQVEALLHGGGFAHTTATHVTEPPELLMGKQLQKQCLIVEARLQESASSGL